MRALKQPIGLAVGLFLTSCHTPTTKPGIPVGTPPAVQTTTVPAPVSTPVAPQQTEPFSLPMVTEAQGEFGRHILQSIWKNPGVSMQKAWEETGANPILSPASLYWALGMTREGAATTTRTGMNQALFLPNGANLPISGALGDQIRLVTGQTEGVSLSVANGIWYQPNFGDLSPALLSAAAPYKATLSKLTGNSTADGDAINQFVSDATQKMIPTIVTPMHLQDAAAALVNALFFKADWTYSFDEKDDQPGRFCTYDPSMTWKHKGATDGCLGKPVQFMQQKRNIWYRETDKAQMVMLPYGKDKAFSMLLVLPKKGFTVQDAIEQTSQGLRDFSDAEKIALQLPFFTVETSVGEELKQILSQLGMPDAFISGKADFSKLFANGERNFLISSILHKTKMEVTHKGTTAAAATAVVMLKESMSRTVSVTFDHPFVLGLYHTPTSTPLFLGIISDPKQPNTKAASATTTSAGKKSAAKTKVVKTTSASKTRTPPKRKRSSKLRTPKAKNG